MITEIGWTGPLSFVPKEGRRCAMEEHVAGFPGIYLWTVSMPDGFLVNYVGVTRKAISWRLQEHVECYIGGKYDLYNPTRFAAGEKQLLHRGTESVLDFLPNHLALATHIHSFLRTFDVFVAPLDCDMAGMERVESGIIEAIRSSQDQVAVAFLDNRRLSRCVAPSDKVRVAMRYPPDVLIRGVGTVINA